jgi:hypothetical protein
MTSGDTTAMRAFGHGFMDPISSTRTVGLKHQKRKPFLNFSSFFSVMSEIYGEYRAGTTSTAPGARTQVNSWKVDNAIWIFGGFRSVDFTGGV